RHARVYVSVLGDEEARKQSLKALQSAAGLMRGEFARRAHLRVAPELEFRYDEGIERGQRIFQLLHSLENESRA
ncbi:30S ribosome-binding factor RbfA, partial [Vibrio parahaemolyticus]